MNQLERLEHLKKMTLALSNSPTEDYKKVMAMFSTIGDVVGVLMKKNKDLMRMQHACEINEARYKAVFDNSPDALFLMENDLYVDCNIRALELFNCSRKDILNQNSLKFSPTLQPDGIESSVGVKQHITAALQGLKQSFKWRHLRADGSSFDAQVRLNRIGKNGNNWLMACLHEIEQRKDEIPVPGR